MEGLDVYYYLKRIIQLWPGYWANQIGKTNEAVGTNNCLTMTVSFPQSS